MRTISVRLSLAEHRLLHDLAGARRVSVETLVREALALPPIHTQASQASPARRLEVVRSEDTRPSGDGEAGPTAPIA
jgi:hypothetical protein